MEIILILIIVILVYLLLKKNNNKTVEGLEKKADVYGKALKNASNTFLNTLKDSEDISKGVPPSDLFVNNMLNPEFAIEPSLADDEEFYQTMQKYNKNGELNAWGPFDHLGVFDAMMAPKASGFKMYWLFVKITKDQMKNLLNFNLTKNSIEPSIRHIDLFSSKEFLIYAKVFITKKNPVRWIANVELQFDESKAIFAGSIGSNNQSGFWSKLDSFINGKIEPFDNPIKAYEDNLD